jgi:hypothetical protein
MDVQIKKHYDDFFDFSASPEQDGRQTMASFDGLPLSIFSG